MGCARLGWVLALAVGAASVAWGQTPTVSPVAQTPPAASVPITPSIWVNPSDSAHSLVFASDGSGGLHAYDLAGDEVSLGGAGLDDVASLAVVYDMPVQGLYRDYLVVGSATARTLTFLPIDGTTGALGASAGTFSVLLTTGNLLDRIAPYRSPITGAFFVFVSDRAGNVEQWQLVDTGQGNIGGTQVERSGLSLGEQLGGMIADEVDRGLYLTSQNSGLWRADAEPGSGTALLVDSTSGSLQLIAPLGGLALYRAHGAGYLLVADLGSSDFAVYHRAPTSAQDYVTRFQVGSGNGLDGVQNPQQIAVMSFPLGTAFPQGLFVSDDQVTAESGPELKYVEWSDIADAGSLATPYLTDNPHTAPDGGFPDGGATDGGGDNTHHTSSGCSTAGGSWGGFLLLALFTFPLLLRRRTA